MGIISGNGDNAVCRTLIIGPRPHVQPTTLASFTKPRILTRSLPSAAEQLSCGYPTDRSIVFFFSSNFLDGAQNSISAHRDY